MSISTSGAFLDGLDDMGIAYLFCNLGTDHAPLIEEMAQRRRDGRPVPQTLLVPHENVAVHMAAGYAVATGQGQVVLVHVDAGTANSAMALHNLCRARIPVMLMAGKAPFSVRGELPGSRDTFVHFLQEPYDQGSVVRPYVKWEYTLPSGVIAKEVLRRGHTLMQSDPPGPVYLMLPREVLAAPVEQATPAFPAQRYGAVRASGLEASRIDAIVHRLLSAEHPVLITAYAGRNPQAPALIDELAQRAGIRVFESNPIHLNVSHESPCFLGFMPGEHVSRADMGLLIDVDIPWIPRDVRENPATHWVQIDVDAVKRDFPMWGFPTSERHEADSTVVLAQVLEALHARATPEFAARVAARRVQIDAERARRAEQIAAAAADPGTVGAINPQWFCARLGQRLAADDIVLNEAIRNGAAVNQQIPRTEPGTLIGLLGGGLGYSGGMALGLRLARPQSRVVNIVGDGSFYFSNPEAVLAVAGHYGLPLLTVVLDNSGWGAVKEATLRMYPKGLAAERREFEAHLAPGMDFSHIARAAGAVGLKVDDPAGVEAALDQALAALDRGQAAVLHVRIASL